MDPRKQPGSQMTAKIRSFSRTEQINMVSLNKQNGLDGSYYFPKMGKFEK